MQESSAFLARSSNEYRGSRASVYVHPSRQGFNRGADEIELLIAKPTG